VKTGFIGCGNMGGVLLKSLLHRGALNQREVVVSTRTRSKLDELVSQYPWLEVTGNVELSKKCSRIFICVKTAEARGVVKEISHNLDGVHLISICAGLEIKNLAKVFPGKITKVIPTLTSEVNAGVSLVCHNDLVGDEDRDYIHKILGRISTVKVIGENNFEVCADLTSCAPAFIASIFREFMNAGVRHGNLSVGEAFEMVVPTLYGTAKLLHEKQTGFEEIITKVATNGGISAEGLKVLDRELPTLFDELFEATLSKHEVTKKQITEQYDKLP
jgi:pyrroline-5-carboxylate reductase